MPYQDLFGFLKHPHPIDFGFGSIEVCADYKEGLRAVEEEEHVDGYLYPPCVSTHRQPVDESEPSVPLPNTARPAAVFDMPMSHEIYIADPVVTSDHRHHDGALIVHLTAFLFGTRLQFKGWHFDGRIPTDPKWRVLLAPGTPADFINWVYKKWKGWVPSLRRRYTNILYMHGRAESCLWDWDRFICRYMVFDAIWKFHEEAEGMASKGHRDRLVKMCERYDIPQNSETINAIYKLRNDLLHEALWDESTPGSGVGDNFLIEKWVGCLNAKLIVAMTGYANAFTRQGWWFMGAQVFDPFRLPTNKG